MYGNFNKFTGRLCLAVAGLFAIAQLFGTLTPVGALSINGARDCDNNAIIYCGAMSTAELRQKYSDNEDVRRIFSHFGIGRSHMDSIEEKAVAGYVNKDNTVTVNGKVVATDVITLGRQNMEGSTSVTYKNGTFYKRPPSVSFASSSLPAFVVMNNGKFGYAIIASCGNPVIKRVTPKPAPTPDNDTVKNGNPTPSVNTSSSAEATAVASASVTNVYHKDAERAPINQSAQPASAPVAQPVAVVPQEKAQPQRELPKTGAGSALSLAGAAGIFSSIGHYIYKRRYS